MVSAILAIISCVIYFLAWILFDNLLVKLISEFELISYALFFFIFSGVAFTITSVITGGIDLKRIKAGIYSKKGRNLDAIGVILGSILVLFGFILWLIDFFGIINIIS